MDISEYMAVEPLLVNIAMLIIGGVVGHKLALRRDRRIEFNKIVDEINPILWAQRDAFQINTVNSHISDDQFRNLRSRTSLAKAFFLDLAWKDYKKHAVPSYDEYSQPSIDNFNQASKAVKRLIWLTKRK